MYSYKKEAYNMLLNPSPCDLYYTLCLMLKYDLAIFKILTNHKIDQCFAYNIINVL